MLQSELLQPLGEAVGLIAVGPLEVEDQRVDILRNVGEPHGLIEHDERESMRLGQLDDLRRHLLDARAQLQDEAGCLLIDQLAKIIQPILLRLLEPQARGQDQVIPADEWRDLDDLDHMHPADAAMQAVVACRKACMGEYGTLEHVLYVQLVSFHGIPFRACMPDRRLKKSRTDRPCNRSARSRAQAEKISTTCKMADSAACRMILNMRHYLL